MNNSYWSVRQNNAMTDALNTGNGVASLLLESYQKALIEIEKELFATIQKYDLGSNEWYKKMTKSDIASIQRLYEQMVASGVPQEVASKFRLGIIKANHLEALQKQVEAQIIQLHNELHNQVKEHLKATYQGTYAEIIKSLGTDIGLANLPVDAIEEAILYNWSGTNFSNRIWNNSDKMSNAIKDVIVNGISRGDDVDKMAKQLAKILDSSFKNALRLIRTETSFIFNTAAVDAYQKSEMVIGHTFLAYIDSRTSKVCKGLDGEKFLYAKTEPIIGVNTPPMHPYCRSTVVPILKEVDYSGSNAETE